MPNTITLPSAKANQKITHDPLRVMSGDPRDVIGDNPFLTMTEDIIFGAANSLLQIVDDVTGLDLLPAAKLLEDAFGSALGGAGFPNFLTWLDHQPEVDISLHLPTPSINPTGLLSGLISWVSSGFGLLDPAESMIKQLLAGAGSLGTDIADWAAHFNPADIFTAPGIFASIMNAGKLLGGLIPALDASIIQTGQFLQSQVNGLEDALAGAGTGFVNIVKALVPGSAGLIDDLGVWEQNLMSGDWMRQFGSALTGLHAPTIKDIENWANGLRTKFESISVADIFDLPDLNIFNIGQVAKPTTTPNLLSNSNFATPILGIAPWKWEGPQLFCFTVGGTGEPVGTGHASQVGSALDGTEFSWVPVAYSASMYPMADSIADGIEKLVAAIQSTPAGSKITGVAVSQGAVVWSKVWENEFVATGGRLHSRMNDVVGVVTFGNPRRKAGSHAPGTPDPGTGTHGIAATDLQTNVPSWWYDYANPDDIVPTVAAGAGGDFASLLYDFLTNDWDGVPETLIADVISALGNPLDTLSSLYRMVAMVAGDAWKSLTGNNPHTTYNTVKIDGTHTSVELAVAYLNSVGAANVSTTFQSADSGSGSISVSCNGTWQEWDHPEPVSVSEGQTLTLACKLMGDSISSAGGNNFRIVLERKLNGAHVDYVYPVSSTATGTFGWTTVTGTYDVPSGVDSVVVGVAATNAATFGTYHVDQLTLTKTGLLPRSNVNGLQLLISNLFGGFDTIGTLLQVPAIPSLDATKITSGLFDALRIPGLDVSKIVSGVFGTGFIPGLDVSKIVSGVFGAGFIPTLDASKIATGVLNTLRIPNLPASIINSGTFLASLIPNLNASIINAGTFLTSLIPALDATKITTGTFATGLIPNITKAMSTDIQGIIDNVYQAINGGTTTNNTLASVKAALSAIPGANIIGSIASSLVSGVLNVANIPGLDVSKIISGVFGAGFIPTLDASKIATGVLNTLRIPDITKAMSTDLTKMFGLFNTASTTGPNTLPNPSFENTNYPFFGSAGTYVYSTEQAHTGTTSLKITGRAAATYTFLAVSDTGSQLRIPCAPNDVYYLEGYVYGHASNVQTSGGASGVQVGLSAYNSAGVAINNYFVSLTASTALNGVWTKVSGYVTMPAGATSFAPYALLSAAVPAAEVYYFDDLVAKEVTEGQNIVQSLFGSIGSAITGAIQAIKVPSLDASKIATGQFLTSLIPNLNASIINAGTFAASLIPNLNASIINAGTFLTSLIPSLDATKITTGIFGAGRIPDITKAMSGDLLKVFNMQGVRNAAGPNIATDPTCSNAAMWPTTHSGGTLSISTTQFRSAPSSLKDVISSTQYGSFPLAYDTTPAFVYIPVIAGRTYYAEAWVKADAANVSTTFNSMLQFQAYDSTGVNTIQQTNKGALVPNSTAWQKMSGYYTIPTGYDRLVVVATYGAGGTIGDTYYFDDISIYEVTEAQNIVQSLFGSIGSAITGAIQAIKVPSLDASKIATGQFLTSLIPNLNASIINAGTFAASLIPNLNASIINAGTFLSSLIPALDATKITTGTFATGLIPNITKAMSTDIQATIDNIYQAINGGTSTGNTIASVKAALSAIPGANIIGSIASSLVSGVLNVANIPGLDVSKIVSGTFGTGFIPGLDVSKIVSGVFGAGFIPTLDASKIVSGILGAGQIPNITKAMSTDIQGIIDNVYQAINGGVTTGNTLASVKTALANIPGANIVSALAASVIPALDAAKITTGQFVSSLIPNLNASIINAGTFLTSLIPSLDATKITTGILGTGQIPGLDVSKIVTGVFGTGFIPSLDAAKITTGIFGTGRIPDITQAMSSGIQAVVDNVYQAINGGTSTGNLVSTVKTALANIPGANIVSAILASIVPVLDASKITTGTLGVGLIPSLDVSKITSGIFSAARLPDITQAMSSGIQAVVDNVYQAINGGTSTGNLVSTVKTALSNIPGANVVSQIAASIVPALDASRIQTGQFLSSLIPNLNASIINAGTFINSVIPNITKAMSTDLQTFVTNIFGGTSIGTVVQAPAVPTLDASKIGTGTIGTARIPNVTRAMSSDVQGIIDSVNQAINGGVATNSDPSSLTTSLQNIPASNVLYPPDPISTITQVSAGAGGYSTTEYAGGGAFLNPYTYCQWTESIGATADYMVIPVVWHASIRGLGDFQRTVTVGVQGGGPNISVPSLGAYQLTAGVFIEWFGMQLTAAQGIRGTTQTIQAYVFDYQTDANNIMHGIVGQSISYRGVARPGTISNTALTTGTALSQTVSSGTGYEVVQVFTGANGASAYTGYTKNSRYNTNAVGFPNVFGDSAGAASVTFAATGANAAWIGSSLNLVASANNAIGSGLMALRTSTTGVSTPVTGNNTLPANWFNSLVGITPDMTYSSSTNTLTVARAGWYHVDVALNGNAVVTSPGGSYQIMRAIVYQNGSPAAGSASGSLVTSGAGLIGVAGSFVVYCSAGDTLAPGYATSNSYSGPAFVGESTGLYTYFKVSLLNRSLA